MSISRRIGAAAAVSIAIIVGAASAGAVGETRLQQSFAWSPDHIVGRPSANAILVEVPYILVVSDEHCAGQVRRAVQIGPIGPVENPCLRVRPGGGSYGRGDVARLRGGYVLWRETFDNGPYRYTITSGSPP